MRGIVRKRLETGATTLLALVLVLVVAGCSRLGSKKKTEMQSAVAAADPYPALPVEQPAETYVPYALPEEADETGGELTALATGWKAGPTAESSYAQPRGSLRARTDPARFHVVAKNDTLYALARKYYGDARHWKDIFEANRAALRNPNLIMVGQRLMIP